MKHGGDKFAEGATNPKLVPNTGNILLRLIAQQWDIACHSRVWQRLVGGAEINGSGTHAGRGFPFIIYIMRYVAAVNHRLVVQRRTPQLLQSWVA